MNNKMPPAPKVNLELWRELYRAAAQFQDLAPWNWMSDNEVLGINNSHGVRILTVLGAIREVFGLAGYRGTDGANVLLLLRSPILEPSPEFGYRIDALLADFVPAHELDPEDKQVIKAIAFKPSPAKPRLWPKFRSHSPGFVPWFLDETEAGQLIDNLQKAVLFATLLRQYPNFFAGRGPSEVPFFPAAGTDSLKLEQFTWHTVLLTPPAGDPAVDPHSFDDLPILSRLPQPASAVWELDAFFTPARIMQPPRPYCPKMGMIADAHSGMVLSAKAVSVNGTMAKAAAETLAQALRGHGRRPATILAGSEQLIQALAPLTDALGITVRHADRLPMIEQARESLKAALSRP